MSPLINAILSIVLLVLNLYMWVLIGSAVMSWLVAFNVINTRNRVVYAIGDVLYRLTEPVLRPIRRVMPNLGGLDLSPMIVVLIIIFLERVIIGYAPYFG